ncbi:MAG: PEP-CTERM sorting domain-containing protein [Deltaproteobacteria bacterium]|nr:PEP-CTERM sorting domain-containing protein [Deltaproteobacteria bacterium]MBW2418476.1 PEP-CTERM sorting domain-containing protein [Deltaproteobacteria bacterium]
MSNITKALFMYAAIALVAAPFAHAVPLPPVGAYADARAVTPTDDAGTVTNTGPSAASATNSASGTGDAESFSQAIVGGALRSRSFVESASGSSLDSNARADAHWVGHFQTQGTDPGSPVDVNLDLRIDGSLDYANNNTNVGPGDLLTRVTLRLILHDMATGATSVFDGAAELSSISRFVDPAFNRSGSWADPSRDGDFDVPSCSPFSCQVDVDATIRVDDALLVGFGSVFGVEVQLLTYAFQSQGQETGASSEFANTASVALSTDTPGVSFAMVPEPGTGLLAGIGLALLGGVRRRA